VLYWRGHIRGVLLLLRRWLLPWFGDGWGVGYGWVGTWRYVLHIQKRKRFPIRTQSDMSQPSQPSQQPLSQLRSIPVEPLPLTSGGAPNQTQKEMEKTNKTLTMLMAQSNADSAFDPPPPGTVTAPSLKESFCGSSPFSYPPSAPYVLLGLAVVCIMVGSLSKE
jgi:hypothetical protein